MMRKRVLLLLGAILLFPLVIVLRNILQVTKLYNKTPVNKIEIKTTPQATVVEASADGGLLDNSNIMFSRLFDYIRGHDISMTVPVESDIDRATMRFYIEEKYRERELHDENGVHVLQVPQRMVASIGVQGDYSKENIFSAQTALQAWLAGNDIYQADGPSYVAMWDGPYKPPFLRRFEVHIPVVRKKEMTHGEG
jgi:hypothetical protein